MGFSYMNYLKILLLFIFTTIAYAKPLIIDNHTEFYDLLSHSEIYIDKSRKLTIDDIQKSNINFIKNNKKLLGYGYSPNFDVWVKFTLHNNTDNNLNKIIKWNNVLTTHIEFYDGNKRFHKQKDGLFNINTNRKTISPIFNINLDSRQTYTYYIKASSTILPLIIKLNLWENDYLYQEEIEKQFYLALFFGAMFILGFYNLFIYFFTKDVSYLFYVLYIFGIIYHHLIYIGIGNIYLFNQSWIISNIKFASLIVAFPIFSLALFSKSFLNTKQYPIFNNILNIFLLLMPLSIFIFLSTNDFNKYRNIVSFLLILYLTIITVYAALKKNRQAYFVLFGEVIITSSFTIMYLSSIGVFNLYNYFPYFIEIALVLEAIVFSIALADKIKQLQKDKIEANQKLLNQQQNEKERLSVQVAEKTDDLKIALDEKGLLLKELNHRVKNNMQTIVSLIRLQSDDVEDEKSKDIFITIQSRLNAMSHLHELLYNQEIVSDVNAHEYFDILIDELRESYPNNVSINFDIKTNLIIEQAVYCGLILNELVTNSFKYAFKEGKGSIYIQLYKNDNQFNLIIWDNGTGYDKTVPSNSLGLVLVNTLSKHQLKGNIIIDSNNGVKVTITWRANA